MGGASAAVKHGAVRRTFRSALRAGAAVARVAARHSNGGGLPMTSLLLLVVQILDIYKYILIAAAVLSWLIAFDVLNTRSRAVYMISDFLNRVTEPVLRPIRRILPSLGGIDVSPIIAILLIWLIQDLIIRNLL
jgi:YggT family protein